MPAVSMTGIASWRERAQQFERLGARQRLQFLDEVALRGGRRRAGADQQVGVEQRRGQRCVRNGLHLMRAHDRLPARSKIGM